MEPDAILNPDSSYNSTIGLLIASVLAFAVYVRVKGRNLPPGPACLPVLGSVGFFKQFKRKRHLLLSELEDKYGKVFSIRAGQQLVVFLNGYDLIREAFVDQKECFSDRPNWLPSLQQGLIEGKGLVWQDASHVLALRKFALQALRGFGVGKATLEDKIFAEIDDITNVLNQHESRKINLKPLLKKSVINVIHDIIFGIRFDYEDSKLQDVSNLIDEFFKGGIFIPKNFLPKLLCKLLSKDEKEYARKQAVVGRLRAYIDAHIHEHEKLYDADNTKDFIDLYIQLSRKDNEDEKISKGDMFRSILDLFLAGSETTAGTLHWCFMFMVKYPHVQEKCFQEIIEVTAERYRVDTKHKSQLPYTEATLLEIQRLSTIAPLGVPHATSRDTTLGGYDIPRNTMVFANLYSCSMDHNVWSKPYRFCPDRHIGKDGKFHRHEKLIPFSIGPRMCLGDSMAKNKIFLVFTNLLRQFSFAKAGSVCLNVDNVREDQPMSAAENFDVIVTRRTQ